MSGMTSRERVMAMLHGEPCDRPLFCPAVYEHKARLINSSPSEVSQDHELLSQATLTEYEIYRPDILTVGIDIYNIEAEALGCCVRFSNEIDFVPTIDKKLLADVEDTPKAMNVDPEKSGRMPLVLAAAEKVHNQVGNEVIVRGGISGPYSTACSLLGAEQMMMACLTQTEEVNRLLMLCTNIAIKYGKAFLMRGMEVCVFDSQTTPPLMSPQVYGQLVLPHVRRLIDTLKNAGAKLIEYVVGGNTQANVDNLFATGANIILSDYMTDVNVFVSKATSRRRLVRHNIDPGLIEHGDEQDLLLKTKALATFAGDNPKIIVGTGVLSYNTSIERVLLVKDICMKEFFAR